MKISDYDYGKVTKTLKNAVTFLNRSRGRIIKEMTIQEDHGGDLDYLHGYDITHYLPPRISCRLNCDEADWLESKWFDEVEVYISKMYKRKIRWLL
jgi:hypothetical protein